MTWLYSILFAGLLVASDNRPMTNHAPLATSEMAVSSPVLMDETEKFEQTYPLNANGRVSVSNVNGSITIEAWDKNEVRLEATKFADTKEALAKMELDIHSTNDRFSVEVDYKNQNHGKKWGRGRMEVQFRLSVPRTAVLDEIEAVNGSVTVSNFTNITKISAVNGQVTATNLRGTANLSTVNGTVRCDFERLDGGSKVSLSTVNGQISLTIPSDANARVKADTLNGNIKNDFGLRVKKGEYVGRDLYGRIGSGDAYIKLDSVNGQLAINRKNDGKSLNPVTDLLPSNGSDDGGSMAGSVNRSIDRSVKASQRQTEIAQRQAEAAVRNAQKEIERIRPEINKIKIKELENLKIDIDTKAIEKGVSDIMRAQADVFARMSEAMWTPGVPMIEKQSRSFPVRGVPKVSIDANGCSVSVRGSDISEVKYSLTQINRGHETSKTAFSESATDSGVTIKVTGTGEDAAGPWSSRNGCRLEVFVPRKSNIRVVTDGEIRVGGISGEIDVTGSDETIDLRESDGKLKVTANDAQVRVVDFSGDFVSQTEDGAIFLEGNFKSIKSRAGDGPITLTLPAQANATITSNSGVRSERADGVRESDGKWRFGTGGSTYDFIVADGEVIVRNLTIIDAQ